MATHSRMRAWAWRRRRLTRAVLTAGTLMCFPAAAQLDEPPVRGDIAGSVAIFGCTPGPTGLRVIALPMEVVPDPAAAPLVRDRDMPVEASITATDDRHTFSFILPGLPADRPYLLRGEIATGACGRVFWDSPSRLIVSAGGRPVRLAGYAVRSSIEVLGEAIGGRTRPQWVGAEHVDVSEAAGSVKQFRWRTDIPGITGGMLQVSTEMFDKEGETARSCLAPRGLVHSAAFPSRSGVWNDAPRVNFTALAQQISAGRDGVQRLMTFRLGAPFYVRIVPLFGRTPRCDSLEDGPSPWVVLANGFKSPNAFSAENPPLPGAGLDVMLRWGAYKPPTIYQYPAGTMLGVRVIRKHSMFFASSSAMDPWGHYFHLWPSLTTCPNLTAFDSLEPGCRLWFQPSSGSFDLIGGLLGGFQGLITGTLDALGLAVNESAAAWESIKAAVVKVVASAISATGIADCAPGSVCAGLVETALNTGLAAMGVPPSLPNWDQLVDQGFEYMAYQVASQAGVAGVPGVQQLTKEVAEKMVSTAVAAMKQNRGADNNTIWEGGPSGWLMWDAGVDPAVLTLGIQRLSTGWLDTNLIKITGNAVYEATSVPLPGQWPTSPSGFGILPIPVVLRANIKGFTPPTTPDGTPWPPYNTAVVAKEFWRAKVEGTPCAIFGIGGYATSGPLILSEKGALAILSVTPPEPQFFAPPFHLCPGN